MARTGGWERQQGAAAGRGSRARQQGEGLWGAGRRDYMCLCSCLFLVIVPAVSGRACSIWQGSALAVLPVLDGEDWSCWRVRFVLEDAALAGVCGFCRWVLVLLEGAVLLAGVGAARGCLFCWDGLPLLGSAGSAGRGWRTSSPTAGV